MLTLSKEKPTVEPSRYEIPQIRLLERILLLSILPTVCSTAIGFVFFRTSALNIHLPTFEFVHVAVVASVFFYSIVYLGKRNASAVFLLLFLLTLLLTRSTRLMWVVRDFVDTCGIAAAVLLYERIVRESSGRRREYFGFLFSGILGVCCILAWSLQFVFVQYLYRAHEPMKYLSLVYMAGFLGFFVGLGIGIGIMLNRKLIESRHARNTTD